MKFRIFVPNREEQRDQSSNHANSVELTDIEEFSSNTRQYMSIFESHSRLEAIRFVLNLVKLVSKALDVLYSSLTPASYFMSQQSK